MVHCVEPEVEIVSGRLL